MTAPRDDVVKVVHLAYPLIDELDLFGAYSVLTKAAAVADRGPAPRLEVWTAAGTRQLTGSAGIPFTVARGLDSVPEADVVVVGGGRGARRAAEDARLVAALRSAAGRGASVYAVCTGALPVAAAGLARGRRLAVHHGKRDLLDAYPVGEVGRGLVRDGRVCSVGGDLASSVKSVDIAFQVLADFAPGLLDAVTDRMELCPGRGAAAERLSGRP